MKTQFGTCYFVSLSAAEKYYSIQEIGLAEVLDKIKNKDIFIGEPEIIKGETLILNSEGRYIIER